MTTRYWKVNRNGGALSLGVTEDSDLRRVFPFAVELTEAEHAAEAAAIAAAHAKPPPVLTDLTGNRKSHTTDANAKRVTVVCYAPNGGARRTRPTIDGRRVLQGQYVFERSGFAMTIETNAGNNDVQIIEEF